MIVHSTKERTFSKGELYSFTVEDIAPDAQRVQVMLSRVGWPEGNCILSKS